ncbi:hypothetical protein H5410_035415 [Solanum commersonii]|uniref:Uncharacterized protein n=1 Tax=Solanum commersonii TaxID=4109 RepID=A0A9J5Y2U3_SOLCO|nr:hypothetical protein H5410_035415 [Solanum commersonii]
MHTKGTIVVLRMILSIPANILPVMLYLRYERSIKDASSMVFRRRLPWHLVDEVYISINLWRRLRISSGVGCGCFKEPLIRSFMTQIWEQGTKVN